MSISYVAYEFLFDIENRDTYTFALCIRIHKHGDGRKGIVI